MRVIAVIILLGFLLAAVCMVIGCIMHPYVAMLVLGLTFIYAWLTKDGSIRFGKDGKDD